MRIKMETWEHLFVVASLFTVFFVKSSFLENSVCPRRKRLVPFILNCIYTEPVQCKLYSCLFTRDVSVSHLTLYA